MMTDPLDGFVAVGNALQNGFSEFGQIIVGKQEEIEKYRAQIRNLLAVSEKMSRYQQNFESLLENLVYMEERGKDGWYGEVRNIANDCIKDYEKELLRYYDRFFVKNKMRIRKRIEQLQKEISLNEGIINKLSGANNDVKFAHVDTEQRII